MPATSPIRSTCSTADLPPTAPRSRRPLRGRVRLRVINAASDTAYRLAVGGHHLTVTHADGFPVEPVIADAVLVGMGERYDVVVDVQPGAHPLVAVAEGKAGHAAGVLRAGAGSAPSVDARPLELDGRLLSYEDLRPAEAVRLPAGDPDVDATLDLTGEEMRYTWGIDGKAFGDHEPVEIEEGQLVRLALRNRSGMWHPMHLHGHTFALEGSGARKDTVNVLPDQEVAFRFRADNPGQWMLHCHNTYHFEAGMATLVSYVR
jgi:FtsP/CotA-like multicopper oxidase with cupredoxin domain